MKSMIDGENPEPESRGGDGQTVAADDEFYAALSATPRRRVLGYLLEHEECSVEELADGLCGWETVTETVVSPERRREVHIALYHVHLPVLSDADLVTYDPEEGHVSIGDLSPSARDLVRRGIEAEQR
jgi:DNA-binding transcriptional ArsR family regulator